MKKSLLLYFLILSISLFGNPSFRVSGTVSDATSGEDLIGASMYVKQIEHGTTTNTYGFYTMSMPPGLYSFSVSFLGYETLEYTLAVERDMVYNIKLNPRSEEIGEIVVSTEARNQNIVSNEMGTVKLSPQTIKVIPVIFGEQDILKTIQLLPGVSSSGEGSTGFFVRGGQADQNLVLLDDAPVFNSGHLLGFFSVFNSDVVNDVKLYKGGVPANFGGRSSSVLDVRMREGNSEHFSASGGLGLISSRLTLEGPIVKSKSSFLLSGRRTYADLFLLLADNEILRKSKLYFYDLNAKIHVDFGDKDRLFLSGYLGRDALKTDIMGFDWGNKVGTMRWFHKFSPRFVSNTSLIYNDYDYKTAANLDFSFDLKAGVIGQNVKQRFIWYINNDNTVSFGVEATRYLFKPGNLKLVLPDDNVQSFDASKKQGIETAAYISNEQKVGSRFSIGYGLRVSGFTRVGKGTEYQFDVKGELADSSMYGEGEFYSPYWYVEPRLNTSLILNENASIKAGYNRLSQYVHLLQNATSGTPVDLWVPSSPNVKPQLADQVSLGFFRNFNNHIYQFSAETYYKWMYNQIDYKTGAEIILNEMVEGELLYGSGKAYGLELMLEKAEGKLTGWISYTLSRSLKQIDGINNNYWYPARQDRIHDFAIVGIYRLNPKWTISANWIYYTGNAVTFPAGKYYFDGKTVNLYTERNGYRMPDYHRLDIGTTWLLAEKNNYRSELNFSVYNAYGHKNAFNYIFTEDPDNQGKTKTVMVYLFSVLPSVTWNFKF